jgi:nitrogen fixation NifU-like protein
MAYEMYQEQILDHYKHPRNRGEMPDADLHAHDYNPLCGDDLSIYLKTDAKGTIIDVKFTGQGCAISQSSASMLTVMLKGKTVADAKAIDPDRIVKMLGIPLSAVRLKCALLSLQVLKKALFSKELSEAETMKE